MDYTRVELGFTRYGYSSEIVEDFKLDFRLKDESLGEVFDKVELLLKGLGFVTEGKELRLVDLEPESNKSLLTESDESIYTMFDDSSTGSSPFTVFTGGKD